MNRRDFAQAVPLLFAGATAPGPVFAEDHPAKKSAIPNAKVGASLNLPPFVGYDKYIEKLERIAPFDGSAHEPGKNRPILQPIDKGAIDLLSKFTLSSLVYSHFEVEYLVNTINEHINTCINLGEKAQ